MPSLWRYMLTEMKKLTTRLIPSFGLAIAMALAIFTTIGCNQDDGEEVTFADVESVYNKECQSCHLNGDNYAPVMSGYEALKDAAMNKSLIDRIQGSGNVMPPSGKMSDERIQTFVDWVNGGYLE